MFAGLSRMSMFDTYHMLDKKAPVAAPVASKAPVAPVKAPVAVAAPVAPKAVVKAPVAVAAPVAPVAPVKAVVKAPKAPVAVAAPATPPVSEEKPRPKLRVIHALLASEKPKRETVMGKLWAEARTKGIPNYNKLKKAELLAALQSK